MPVGSSNQSDKDVVAGLLPAPPPLEEVGSHRRRTHSPRSAMVRSLSLPYRIEAYQEEIRQLEERILRGSGSHPGLRSNGSADENTPHKRPWHRSLSLAQQDLATRMEREEEIVRHCTSRGTAVALPSDTDDFVVGSAYDDEAAAAVAQAHHYVSEGVPLPPLTCALDTEEGHAESLGRAREAPATCWHNDDTSNNCWIVPIAEEDEKEGAMLPDICAIEETATPGRHYPTNRNQEKSAESNEQQKRAAETVAALAALFDLPPSAVQPPAGTEQSPVSVRQPLGGISYPTGTTTASTSAPKDVATVTTTPNDSPPRRSIFGKAKKSWFASSTAAYSFDLFGMFAEEGPPHAPSSPPPALTTATAGLHQSSSSPETSQPPSSPSFRMLASTDRAHSLPNPRKSSLKRIASSGSNASATSANSTKTTMQRRNVSFGQLQTREYNIALSDHPSCSFGPPISLGWEFRDRQAVSLEDYEDQRSPRRSMHQMLLSYNVRRYLLLKRAGYTQAELQAAMHEVDRVKRERLVTDLFLPASHLDETLEHVVRHVKGLFGGQTSSSL